MRARITQMRTYLSIAQVFLSSVAYLCSPVQAQQTDRDNWPNKEKGMYAPVQLFMPQESCGDYLRAKADINTTYFTLVHWTFGYLSGLNASLPQGGTVLGSMTASAEDFLLIAERFCAEHPLDKFYNAVTKSLVTITPVDWQGNATYSK